MNELNKDNWETNKERLKQQYSKLTDEDLHYREGKSDEVIARIQKRLGISKDEAIHVVRKV